MYPSKRTIGLGISISFLIVSILISLLAGASKAESFIIGLLVFTATQLTVLLILDRTPANPIGNLLDVYIPGQDLFSDLARKKLRDLENEYADLQHGTVQFSNPNECRNNYPRFMEEASKNTTLLAVSQGDPDKFWKDRGMEIANKHFLDNGGKIKRVFIHWHSANDVERESLKTKAEEHANMGVSAFICDYDKDLIKLTTNCIIDPDKGVAMVCDFTKGQLIHHRMIKRNSPEYKRLLKAVEFLFEDCADPVNPVQTGAP